MIAAEKARRLCYGLGLDPIYVDTAIRRWQSFTNLDARHAERGLLFNEVEMEGANVG